MPATLRPECPKCQRPMEPGSVRCSSALRCVKEPSEWLGTRITSIPFFFVPSLAGFHCPTCRVLVVDYSMQAITERPLVLKLWYTVGHALGDTAGYPSGFGACDGAGEIDVGFRAELDPRAPDEAAQPTRYREGNPPI